MTNDIVFQLQARPATPFALSVSVVTKKLPFTLPSVAPRRRRLSNVVSRSRNMSLEGRTFPRPATSASVSASTSTWGSSTTPALVSTAWISTAACKCTFETARRWDVRMDFSKLIACFLSYRTRPGERVAKRRRCKSHIGSRHKITQAETIKWFKNRFDGIVR